MSKIKLYDSAYPGSMHERDSGEFVRADDSESLAASLLRNLSDMEISRDDWQADAIMFERQRNELLSALQKIVREGDSTAPEDVKEIAIAAISKVQP